MFGLLAVEVPESEFDASLESSEERVAVSVTGSSLPVEVIDAEVPSPEPDVRLVSDA